MILPSTSRDQMTTWNELKVPSIYLCCNWNKDRLAKVNNYLGFGEIKNLFLGQNEGLVWIP
jgi:hypothetical protein